jgi:hypothetical protein
MKRLGRFASNVTEPGLSHAEFLTRLRSGARSEFSRNSIMVINRDWWTER